MRPVLVRKAIPAAVVAAVLWVGGAAEAGDSPWTLQVRAGVAESDAAFGPPVFGRVVDDSDTALSLSLGYDFGRHLGVRAAYHDFGEHEALPAPCPPGEICPQFETTDLVFLIGTAEITGASLSLVPRLPIGESFYLFAEAGVIEWELDVTFEPIGQLEDEFTGTDLLAGVGAGWEAANGVGVEVELGGFDLDVRAVTAGLSWRF